MLTTCQRFGADVVVCGGAAGLGKEFHERMAQKEGHPRESAGTDRHGGHG